MGANISNPTSGEVKVVKVTSSEFEWVIPNFLSLSKRSFSPSFSFAGVSWYLMIFPNGVSDNGRVTTCIFRTSAVPPITLKVYFAIKTLDGKKELERNDAHHIIEDGWEAYAFSDCISRDELLKRASELLPSSVLTVLCSMKQAAEDASGTATSLCSYCKNTLDAESVSSHEKKCTERPIKCPECSDVVLLQDWYDHECKMAKTKGGTATSLCSYCENTLDAESVSSHEKKCTERPIKCPECSEVVLLQDWYDHECKMAKTKGGIATSLCSYCKNTLDAESVSSHEKKCTERPIKCPECSEVILLQDWYGHECKMAKTKGDTATSLCSYCKNTLDAESVSSHEKKCTERPIKCPECSEVVLLQDWYGHECKMAKTKGGTVTSLCSCCKNTLDAESVSSQEKKCTERPKKCPECSEIVLLQDWYGHECQMARTEEDEALIRDLKKMLSDGKNHDLILKIGDKELLAHRAILSCRSHVFASMLNHDMKEKNSGIIEVPDCDPEAMKLFLSYIYTGKVETLDQRHMLALYYIADKYDAQGLKKICHNFIKKSISLTNICQVIQLAVNHSDSNLLEYATEYFIENALDITTTVEWQSFLEENSTIGNELIIKSFRKLKDVKS